MVSYLQFRQRLYRKVFGSQPVEEVVIASYSCYLRRGISVEDWCCGFFAYYGAKVDDVVEEISQWIEDRSTTRYGTAINRTTLELSFSFKLRQNLVPPVQNEICLEKCIDNHIYI